MNTTMMDRIPEPKGPNHTIRVDGIPRTAQDVEILKMLLETYIFWDIEGDEDDALSSYESQFFNLPYEQGPGWTVINMYDPLWVELKEDDPEGWEADYDEYIDFNVPIGYMLTNASITYDYSDSMTGIRKLMVFAYDDDPENTTPMTNGQKYLLEEF